MPHARSIYIFSTGLGIVQRGFETTSVQWLNALSLSGKCNAKLFSGGKHPNSTQIWCIRQNGFIARNLRSLKLIHDGARLQQLSFLRGAKRVIRMDQPDYVFVQEETLAVNLQNWLKQTESATKIIFCNGAPISESICSAFDFVVDLIPTASEKLLETGYPKYRACIISYPIALPTVTESRNQWRLSYGLQHDDRVVLCVAAWNSHHKRINYVIEEFTEARRNDEKLKLVLCGQPSAESPSLMALGSRLLGENVSWITLDYHEMANAYYSSDLFLLASTNEAFGAVIAEAALAGLPILCNDFPSARYILGEDYPGIMEMHSTGKLSQALADWSKLVSFPSLSAGVNYRFSPANTAQKLHTFLDRFESNNQ